MSELKPVTREEKILSGADIEPRTRMEYFLKKASEASSGVPSYTSNDAGKVLTLAETDETVTKFIIPPQTVTLVQSRADLENVIPIDEMIDGEIATFVFEHNGESGSIDMAAYIYKTEEDGVTSASYNDPNDDNSRFAIEYSLARGVWEILVWQGEGDITLSLFTSTPTVAPKWEAPSEGGGGSSNVGIRIVKASGAATYVSEYGEVRVPLDISADDLDACINEFTPVCIFLPFAVTDSAPYWSYNAGALQVFPVSSSQLFPATESAEYLTPIHGRRVSLDYDPETGVAILVYKLSTLN